MARLIPRLVVLAALAAFVGILVVWLYLPEVKRIYWALVSTSGPERHGASVMRVVPDGTPYDLWFDDARGRIPVQQGLVIDDIGTVALEPWPQLGEGIDGLYLRFADYQITDGRILEMPVDGRTLEQNHLYEMGVYALGGPGHTLFFLEGRAPIRLDWQAGSVFSVPLNTRYQHFNDSDEPIRLLNVTSFPFAVNAAADERFVLENSHHFADRFDGDADYFEVAEEVNKTRTKTNFIPDAMTTSLADGFDRGRGRTTMSWPMAGNTVIDLHVSEIPARSHMKAHRHTSDAFILILRGDGYSLTWPGGGFDERKRIDWKKNTLFVPPTYWYHQHFNSGDTPSRHLAINAPTLVRNLGLRFIDQIEVDSPEVTAEWADALKARQ